MTRKLRRELYERMKLQFSSFHIAGKMGLWEEDIDRPVPPRIFIVGPIPREPAKCYVKAEQRWVIGMPGRSFAPLGVGREEKHSKGEGAVLAIDYALMRSTKCMNWKNEMLLNNHSAKQNKAGSILINRKVPRLTEHLFQVNGKKDSHYSVAESYNLKCPYTHLLQVFGDSLSFYAGPDYGWKGGAE
ncbi:hypothetical protein KFK09_012556 [Dendrobium nobile]|uniref:Uncharacterized protein n=1 Tax=Dendrobium nobile TaxID=94219 RepID=A0A8T3BFT5_DENNO|nr:hypothetical protein KFK09_012556 [Dendrobium nobile]